MKMKSLIVGCMAAFYASPLPATTQQADNAGASGIENKQEQRSLHQPSRMYVAIDKFDNKAGINANQFGTIRARIQQAVVGTRKFEVVEREQMKNALSEQNLLAAGMTNDSDVDAPRSGKMKPAGFVIYGNVLSYGIDEDSVSSDVLSASSLCIKVELQLKITNAETGKILSEKSVVGLGQQSRLGTSSANSRGNLQEQCERAAVAEASHYVVDALREVCYPARIIKIGKKEIMINMTEEEVALGDLFDIVESGEEMIDPDTGISLGRDGEVVGRLVITRPGPKVSAGKCVDYWDVDEQTVCKFSIKDLDKKATYLVRRIKQDRLRAERINQRKNKSKSFGSLF